MALKAVFFDVGETLVDEERYRRRIAEAPWVRPHVMWAALRVTIAAHARRGPWGYLQDASAADVRVDSLSGLPEALGL